MYKEFYFIIKELLFGYGEKMDKKVSEIKDVHEYALKNVSKEPDMIELAHSNRLNKSILGYSKEYSSEQIKACIEAVNGNIIKNNITVYRGVKEQMFSEHTYTKMKQAACEYNCDLYSKELFVSTSLDKKVAEAYGDVILRINVPVGSHALYLGRINEPYNYEVLLYDIKLKVLSIKKIDNKKYVTCKLVNG